MVWARASTWSTPGKTGRPGKWPFAHQSDAVIAFVPTIRFAAASYSTMRSTIRIGQRCGISASISRVVWTISLTRGLRRRSRVGRGQEGRAADPIQQVRGHPAFEEDVVPEERPMDLDVRRQPFDEQLVQGRPA